MNLWIYWLIIIVVLAIIEALTVSLVSVWFVTSALICLIISFFCDNIILQFCIFIILGIVLLFFTRKKLLSYMEKFNKKPSVTKTKSVKKNTKNKKKK